MVCARRGAASEPLWWHSFETAARSRWVARGLRIALDPSSHDPACPRRATARLSPRARALRLPRAPRPSRDRASVPARARAVVAVRARAVVTARTGTDGDAPRAVRARARDGGGRQWRQWRLRQARQPLLVHDGARRGRGVWGSRDDGVSHPESPAGTTRRRRSSRRRAEVPSARRANCDELLSKR